MNDAKWTEDGHAVERKMDPPRALTIMGFKTTVAFDGQNYEAIKVSLDEAHTKRMQEIQVILMRAYPLTVVIGTYSFWGLRADKWKKPLSSCLTILFPAL